MITDKLKISDKGFVEKNKINNTFESMTIICDEEHVKVCDCQQEQYNKTYDIVLEQQEKQIREDLTREEYEHFTDDMKVKEIERWKANAKPKTYKILGELNEKDKVRCSVEKSLILETLSLFTEKYDIRDPRVFLVVRSVINHQLSSHRMQLYTSNKGIVQTLYDREGNPYTQVNPIEESKRKFDESIIKAMEQLTRITEGDTININQQNMDMTIDINKLVDKKLDSLDESGEPYPWEK